MSFDPWLPEVILAERKSLAGDDDSPIKNPRFRQFLAASRIDRTHIKPLASLLVFALVASLWLFWHSRARETRLAEPRPTISEQMATDLSKPEAVQTQGVVVVDVSGRVKHPGVYTLPEGSRAIDALTAAGGALPGTDMTSINRAQRLEDGEQILVGTDTSNSSGGSLSRPGKVNLNSASAQELDALPGIGPVLAARIVAWRKANGRFKSVEELRQVSGVGDAKFADLRPLVRTQ